MDTLYYFGLLFLCVIGLMVYIAWAWANEMDNPVERFVDQRRGDPTEEADAAYRGWKPKERL